MDLAFISVRPGAGMAGTHRERPCKSGARQKIRQKKHMLEKIDMMQERGCGAAGGGCWNFDAVRKMSAWREAFASWK